MKRKAQKRLTIDQLLRILAGKKYINIRFASGYVVAFNCRYLTKWLEELQEYGQRETDAVSWKEIDINAYISNKRAFF